jgi:hypothetical protein
MTGKIVSKVDWHKKAGRWTCRLFCYDGVFAPVWLESGSNLSFEVLQGRYCTGYTTLSPKKSNISSKHQKIMKPCPSKTKLAKGFRCKSCYQSELVHACIICDGSKCSADLATRKHCENTTAYVYLASFGLDRVKVGVAHETRIPRRWIDQGANIAKRIIVGNGIEVRRYEKILHHTLDVLAGVRTDKKVDTLWKEPNANELRALSKAEEEIRQRFPNLPFYSEPHHNLSKIYRLPHLNRRPIELKVERSLRVSGKVLGAKGSLLLMSNGDLPYCINLTHLVGRRIEFKETLKTIIQTALDIF